MNIKPTLSASLISEVLILPFLLTSFLLCFCNCVLWSQNAGQGGLHDWQPHPAREAEEWENKSMQRFGIWTQLVTKFLSISSLWCPFYSKYLLNQLVFGNLGLELHLNGDVQNSCGYSLPPRSIHHCGHVPSLNITLTLAESSGF